LIGINGHWGYAVTLLLVDIGVLLIAKRLVTISLERAVLFYWLSPIVIFATYWLGFNDLLPVMLLCLALLGLRERRPIMAGLCCAAAISAKFSMVLALPIIVIYLIRNKSANILLARFTIALVGGAAVLGIPFLASSAAVKMLGSNPEMAKVFNLGVQVGPNTKIYVLPMLYLLALYVAWSMRRISFDLLMVLLGSTFFLVLLLTPASPGWFLWMFPLLLVYQSGEDRVAMPLVIGFSLLYVISNFSVTPVPKVLDSEAVQYAAEQFGGLLGIRGHALLNTALLALGIALVARIWQRTVHNNDYFQVSRKPIVIGVAGDSGSGKDTLVESLTGLFGKHSVASLSGDDYHLWDRHKPMWHVMTHLHPRANDLERFVQDAMVLASGKSIVLRHYDHKTGKQLKPELQRSGEVLFVSGLHALYLPILRDRYDLSIFLQIDEGLRRFLKTDRDVRQRGHQLESVLKVLDRRETDAIAFVRPQAARADLVLSLHPIHPRMLADARTKDDLRFKLIVRVRQGVHEESIRRVLIGVCGLHVDTQLDGNNADVTMTIEGECSKEDVAMAAGILFPKMMMLLDPEPNWEDGVRGMIQLIVLSQLTQALKKRLK
jgi:uridine kinase